MDLIRFWNVLRARWLVVVAVALIGGLSSAMFSALRTETAEPSFRAEASVSLILQSGEESSVTDLVLEEQVRAQQANRDLMLSRPGDLRVDTQDNPPRLIFVASAPSEGQAVQLATDLRDNYLAGAPSPESQSIQTQINGVLARLADIRLELQRASVPAPGEVDREIERSRLTALVTGLQERAVILEQELLFPAARPTEEVQAELDVVNAALEDSQRQLAAIPPAEHTAFSERETRRRALEVEYTLVEEDYQGLLARQTEEAPVVVIGELETFDQAPVQAGGAANAVFAALVGALIGMAGVLAADRVRRPVWSRSDLQWLPLLATLAPRSRADRDRPWYEQAGTSQRKLGVQAIRASVEAAVGSGPATLAVTGLGSHSEAVHELAADLAMSLAVTERSVLLVDADLRRPSGLTEFRNDGPTLCDLLSRPVDDAEGVRSFIKQAISGAHSVRPRLSAMAAGRCMGDPTDTLAGPRLISFLDAAQEAFDHTIVVTPDIREPAAQTVLQRIEYGLLAVTPGRTEAPEMNSLVENSLARVVTLLGTVFLPQRRWVDRLRRAAPRSSEPAEPPLPAWHAWEGPSLPLPSEESELLEVASPDTAEEPPADEPLEKASKAAETSEPSTPRKPRQRKPRPRKPRKQAGAPPADRSAG